MRYDVKRFTEVYIHNGSLLISDLTGRSLLKLYSPTASVSLLNICLYRYRTFAVSPLSRSSESPWRIICPPASSPRRQRQVRTVPPCPETAALPWHEGRLAEARLQGCRPLQATVRLTGMAGLYQRGRQATSRSNCTTCYPARPVYSWRSNAVLTRCWHGRQPFCEHTEQSLSCFVQTTSKQHWTYLQSQA